MEKLSLTIGIPAHNEEANIGYMLHSVLKQKGNSFDLKKILVVLDGCTDNTLKIVKKIARQYPQVKIIHDKKRFGKATRLNQIHRLNRSELLGTFDADIILERDIELELMVQEFVKSKRVQVVAALQHPSPSNNLLGKFGNSSFKMLQAASLKWRNGNNIHSLQGSASMMRKEFSKKIVYPTFTTSDQGYLYVNAITNGRSGFRLAKDCRIIFRSVSTFRDWRTLGARTMFHDRTNMVKIFGEKILLEYRIPKKYIFQGMLKAFANDFLGTIGAILMNVYIRKFPYEPQKRKEGVWEIVSSSKFAIKI